MVKDLLRTPRGLAVLARGALILVLLGGCAVKHPTPNVVRGKQLFVAKCGSCHTLSHASTMGTVGPNLDQAFNQDRTDGLHDVRGLVYDWIQYPNVQGAMPAGLYRGQKAADVAGYVALVASVPGQDTGALARAAQQKVAPTPANGKLVFTGLGGCGSCHTLAAAGTSGTVGPNLGARLASDCKLPASIKARGSSLMQCISAAITKPSSYLPSGYPAGVMPSNFAQTLSKSQVQALVAFLASVSK
ncbi:MAG: c-type cytochrome [Solirubrobacteraceae bacterium]